MQRILAVASTGGHLSELLKLEDLLSKNEYLIVTENTKNNLKLKKKYKNNISFVLSCTKNKPISYLFKAFINVFKALIIILKFKPDYIISTGAHTCVPFFYLAKIFNIKTIYIETFANIKTKTITGRLVHKVSDVFVVQWKEQLNNYENAIVGGFIY